MDGLEGLEALGNLGVVPIVILLTQMAKQRLGDFKYGSDALALALSFVLCLGWEFYYMTALQFAEWSALSGLGIFKWGVVQVGTGFGTWLAASKIYDLGHGDKKKEKAVLTEKVKLEQEIVKLKNGNGEKDGTHKEDPRVPDQLRAILEG